MWLDTVREEVATSLRSAGRPWDADGCEGKGPLPPGRGPRIPVGESPPNKILPSLQEGTPPVSASEDRVLGGLPERLRGSREEPSRGGLGALLLRGGIVESTRHFIPLINPSTTPMSRVVARRPCCF